MNSSPEGEGYELTNPDLDDWLFSPRKKSPDFFEEFEDFWEKEIEDLFKQEGSEKHLFCSDCRSVFDSEEKLYSHLTYCKPTLEEFLY